MDQLEMNGIEAVEVEDGYAPLRNISVLDGVVIEVLGAATHLPRMGVFSGPSGLGKSFAAAHASGKHRAYYVEARSTWTKKPLLLAVLRQMGITPATTVYGMLDQASEQLALSGRPLIVDEMDHLVRADLVEVLRDLYEQSQAPIVLIGEEMLPQKLKRFERFHGRIMTWRQALPCNLQDARALARHYCPNVQVTDDLLEQLIKLAHGSVRRVCVNLDRIDAFGRRSRLPAIGLPEWGDRELYTGEPPKARLL